MEFRVKLPNEAIVNAVFDPASDTSFVEKRTIIESDDFDGQEPATTRSWVILMSASANQIGYETNEISGNGLAWLIRSDGEELQVGFDAYQFREITVGKKFRFGSSDKGVIKFMQTSPTVETRHV